MMKYPKEYLDEIKLRLKVSQIVGKTVKLKRRGKEFIGLSPFTSEKTPSFTVSDEKGFYHCFSSGEHGNIFDFIMKTQSLKFGEAVRQLASEAGMQQYRFTNFDLEKEKRYQTYKSILKDYSEYHHKLILGKETGGSNVQFAINPKNGRMVIIEMNPRVSRSSALASKATGFPIAKVAAKLAVGYTLDELKNEITKVTPASFEPTIDYVVTKVPRFTFEKFSTSAAVLGTSMKSVGEAMAIGRNFKESLQKALVSLETGFSGLDQIFNLNRKQIEKKLKENIPNKIMLVGEAIRKKINIKKIHLLSKIDPWFLSQIKEIIDCENKIKKNGLPKTFNEFNYIKSIGFSDKKLSELANISEKAIRKKRSILQILPVYKKVDTCAAEFKSFTPYMYSTYQRNFSVNSECEAQPSNRKKIIILGGGPNRIGQGIEFDYCCCQASFALKEAKYETIMVNCNPETVSTDYDTSDRLYFEPLIEEYVFNIIQKERSKGNLIGIIAQFGGQTPIKLAKFLNDNKLPILGTQYSSIDLAEDRDRFRNLLNKLNLKQAESGIAKTFPQALKIADRIGLPLMVRPSYVLGGRAMEIVHERKQLKKFVQEAFKAAEKNPILIDKFIDHAMEVDVDAISDGKQVFVAGIMQHIEEAGIHSGDSACSLPPVSIKPFLIKEIENQTRKLALALKVKGLMNIQFAIKQDEIFVIEVNPRASRTIPFVSKAKNLPYAKIASRIMAGEKLSKFNLRSKTKKMFAVKEAVFPFNKFPNSDLLLGPEMKSTGEVMGFDKNFGMAFAKSQIAASNSLPTKGLAFISLKNSHKEEGVKLAKQLIKLNFKLCATSGTAKFINKHGIKCKKINKVNQGSPHIVDVLNSKKIALVINTGGGNSESQISDAIALRRATLANKVPYCTNMSTALVCIEGIRSLNSKDMKVTSLQDI